MSAPEHTSTLRPGVGAYSRGCRCWSCTEAHRDASWRRQAERAERVTRDDKPTLRCTHPGCPFETWHIGGLTMHARSHQRTTQHRATREDIGADAASQLLFPLELADQGACRGQGDLMFSTDQVGIAMAKQVCAGCPVLWQCREHSIVEAEPDGVWGGLSSKERGRLVRARRREAS